MTKYQNQYKTMRERRIAIRQWLLSTSFRAVLVTVVALFGVMYVVQISSASTKGYEISDLNKQIQSLEQENQRLEFEVATHRSMKSIQERLQGTNLVVADDIQYVTLVGTAVAMR